MTLAFQLTGPTAFSTFARMVCPEFPGGQPDIYADGPLEGVESGKGGAALVEAGYSSTNVILLFLCNTFDIFLLFLKASSGTSYYQ